MALTDQPPALSVVVPMYNEEDVLPLLVTRLRPVLDALDEPYEVVAVDDGSSDATGQLLLVLRHHWPQLRAVRLARNCGHQVALAAGLQRALGDYVVSIDADLEHPPEKIPEMLALARSKSLHIVYGVRRDNGTDGPVRRFAIQLRHRLMRVLAGSSAPNHFGDYRLLSRATVDALKTLPEQQPVYRLLVPWIGFSSGEVTYRRETRAAGRSKYSILKSVRLAYDRLVTFSAVPLRIVTWLGALTVAVCLGLVALAVVAYAVGRSVPGWTSLFIAVTLIGGVQMLCTGLLGKYVGRIYTTVQGRPSHFVSYDSLTAAGDPALDLAAAPEAAESDRAAEPAGLPRQRVPKASAQGDEPAGTRLVRVRA